MTRKIVYWVSTSLAAASLLMALTYLSGSEQVVEGFASAGWLQPPPARNTEHAQCAGTSGADLTGTFPEKHVSNLHA